MTSVAKPPPGGKSTAIVKQEAAPDFGDGVRRVRDTDLGEWLGLSRPRDVRKLVERVFPEGERPQSRATVARQSTGLKGGGVRTYEVREYWLTEQEAIFLIARSRTKVAPDTLRRTLANLAAPRPDPTTRLAAMEQRFGELTTLVTSLATSVVALAAPAVDPTTAARRAKWREKKARQRERRLAAKQAQTALPVGQPTDEKPASKVLDRGLSCWGTTFCGELHHGVEEAVRCNNRHYQRTGRWRDIGEAMLVEGHPWPVIDGRTLDQVSAKVRIEATAWRLPVPPRPRPN